MHLDRILLRHFWTTLALAGGVAQWLVWTWLLAPHGVAPGPLWWVLGPLALTAVFRGAAQVLRTRSELRTPLDRVGAAVVAVGFTGLVCGATLGGTLLAWKASEWLFTGPALAGPTVAATGGAGVRPLGVGMLLATVVALTWGFTHGWRRLRVRELTVTVSDLPPAFEGYRIAHVSDVHLGPLGDRAALRDAIARVTALDPDLVCVTGDIVDTPNADVDAWMPELAALRARDGVLAILGNHDDHAGFDRVAAAVRRWTDWRLLRDEVATVARDGAALHVAGHEHGDPDEAAQRLRALWARVPTTGASLLLVHHPHLFDTAAALGVPLTLAGHTHGGQLAVPGLPSINVARLVGMRYDRGVLVRGASTLHVSCGLGTSGQRVRVGVPREITVLRLTGAAVNGARPVGLLPLTPSGAAVS